MSGIAAELSHVDLFADLAAPALERLAGRSQERHLLRGEILFLQDDPASHLYLLRSGRMRVLVTSAHGDDLVLRVLGAGHCIGEVSVLSAEPRSATVDALEDSELLAVPADVVRQVLVDNPAALLCVAARLAGTVRHMTDVASDLVFLDVPRRLAKLLVTEAQPDASGVPVCELGMNQSGVAARLGATRQSLNRALGEFCRRGWTSVSGTQVRLTDVGALRRHADS
ncbi:MAG TPA: Crp/Fnr family transcriptional regulator [Motilibacteraceae bacterium]|nr:Crp/Fnr family transcriptional regulator [Motilibacteraceae bacterium]